MKVFPPGLWDLSDFERLESWSLEINQASDSTQAGMVSWALLGISRDISLLEAMEWIANHSESESDGAPGDAEDPSNKDFLNADPPVNPSPALLPSPSIQPLVLPSVNIPYVPAPASPVETRRTAFDGLQHMMALTLLTIIPKVGV